MHILAHREALREFVDELGAVTVFPAGPDVTFLIDEKGTRGRSQSVLEGAFADVCLRAFGAKTKADDVVVVPYSYACVPQLGGLARWLETIPVPKRPFAVVMLHRPEEGWQINATRQRIRDNPRPMREAAARLHAAVSRGFLILPTNEPLA